MKKLSGKEPFSARACLEHEPTEHTVLYRAPDPIGRTAIDRLAARTKRGYQHIGGLTLFADVSGRDLPSGEEVTERLISLQPELAEFLGRDIAGSLEGLRRVGDELPNLKFRARLRDGMYTSGAGPRHTEGRRTPFLGMIIFIGPPTVVDDPMPGGEFWGVSGMTFHNAPNGADSYRAFMSVTGHA